MGKHERAQVESLERAVVEVLNGGSSPLAPAHPWSKHVEPLARAIRQDFRFSRAVFKGNRYGQVGDVMLVDHGARTIFLELKASGSSSGVGTLANISQDALTKYGVFDTSTTSWSRWRIDHGFDAAVVAQLDRFPKVRRLHDKSDKGRAIRNLAEQGDTLAQQIRRKVTEMATDDKLSYLRYLHARPINPERLKMLVYCLVHGFHTSKQIVDACAKLDLGGLGEQYSRFHTYYSNVVNGKVVVRREDPAGLRWLFTHAVEFVLVIVSGATTCHIVARDREGIQRQTLAVVFHWKNVFQGIQTPCLNVFLGHDLRSAPPQEA